MYVQEQVQRVQLLGRHAAQQLRPADRLSKARLDERDDLGAPTLLRLDLVLQPQDVVHPLQSAAANSMAFCQGVFSKLKSLPLVFSVRNNSKPSVRRASMYDPHNV